MVIMVISLFLYPNSNVNAEKVTQNSKKEMTIKFKESTEESSTDSSSTDSSSTDSSTTTSSTTDNIHQIKEPPTDIKKTGLLPKTGEFISSLIILIVGIGLMLCAIGVFSIKLVLQSDSVNY